MKRAVFVVLLFIPFIPLNNVSAQELTFNLYNPDPVYIHPGSNSTITLQWWNLVDDDRTITIEEDNTPQGITLEGIPFTRGTGPGLYGETWLKVHINESLAYGQYEFNLVTTCAENSNWNDTINVTIEVARPSSLRFGFESSSTYSVSPGVRFGVKINLTNDAPWQDNVTLSLDSLSQWDTGWNMDEIQNENAILQLNNSEVGWVDLWVQVPEVENSVPRSGIGPTFTLSAQSELDRKFVRWEFTIEVGVYKNATFKSIENSVSVDPGGSAWLNISFNNNGNDDTTYDIDLRQVNSDGSPISGAEKSDLMVVNGWKVGLFKDFEEVALQRAGDREFEVSFEAPMEQISEIWVEVIISPKGAKERAISTIVSANIILRNSAELILGEDCNRINVTIGCTLEVSVLNTGNFQSQLKLEVIPGEDFQQTNSSYNLSLSAGESSSWFKIDLTTKEDLLAFTQGNISVFVLNSNDEILSQDKLEYVIDPIISWDWERTESQLDSEGNLSILITIRNNGNAIDGITVRMHTNVFTQQGFIPPDGAITEEGVSNPRSFEVHDVPLRANYSFRAWVLLPENQRTAGELFVNLTIQSQYSVDEPFKFTARENYSAKETKTSEKGVIDDLSTIVDDAGQLFGAWWHIIAAIVFSGFILNKAINDRIKRKENEEVPPKPKEPETVEDWQAGFKPSLQKEEVDLSSPEIDRENFAKEFSSKASPKQVKSNVSEELIEVATTVLDHHDEKTMLQKMDHLVGDILSEPSQPHQANLMLPKAEAITERTNPVKRQDDLDI